MAVWGFIRRFNVLCCKASRIKAYPSYYIQWRASSGSSSALDNDGGVIPVVIIGAGPVGLVLSILLTKLGVNCVVLEKNPKFSKHPQAHFVNNRTMEVFRKLNGLAEEIQRSQPPVDIWRRFIYCTSLSGDILGSVDHMKPQDFKKLVSPISVAHFSQYKLTNLLLKQLEQLNFHVLTSDEQEEHSHGPCKVGEILMGHECVSIDASGSHVTVTESFLKRGKRINRDIQCKYLVGADGAGSTVRKLAGIGMSGEKDLQKLVSVHFLSLELGKYLLNKRPGMLFFIFNSAAIGVLAAHDLQHGEFVLQVPFYPPQQSLEDFTFNMCEKLIFKLVGLELSDVEVVDIKPWVMHAEVAEKFVTSQNLIILAGDAAHRFPPAGGFGMNTGIQDAHNLAWKLASVLKGIAPSSIISTYEKERRPIAVFNTALSVLNFRAAMAVPAALGLDPTIAKSVHGVINNGVGSVLPLGLQRAVLEGIFSVGRAQLSETILNDNNILGSARLVKVRRIFDEGRSLQLQFPAEDLGFRYGEGALVSDGDSGVGMAEAPTGRRRDYIPSTEPGSRLPHMNLRFLTSLPNEEVFSTLDLVRADRVEFLLIIAPLKESFELARGALKAVEGCKVDMRVCVVWPHGAAVAGSKMALCPWENFVDVVEVNCSLGSSASWWQLCGMCKRGAILVRPDDHIAWRVKSTVEGDPLFIMKRVFSAVLGLDQDCV